MQRKIKNEFLMRFFSERCSGGVPIIDQDILKLSPWDGCSDLSLILGKSKWQTPIVMHFRIQMDLKVSAS